MTSSGPRLALLLLCAGVLPSCGGSKPPTTAASSPSSTSGGAPSLSQEGHFVVFQDSGSQKVTVFDRLNATTLAMDPPLPGNDVGHAVLTPDGRFMAFDSREAGGGFLQVFLRDLTTGATALVSAGPGNLPGNGDSSSPSISDDGRFVAFQSNAVDLGARSGSSNSVLIREVSTERIESASTTTTGNDVHPDISGNGQFVSFESQPAAGSGFTAVLSWNRLNGQLLTVSEAPGALPANGESAAPSLSFDGRFVAFESRATNLAPDSSPAVTFAGESNIFVRDILTRVLVTASVPKAAGTTSNGDSRFPSLSRDGRRVAFASTATNLTADVLPPGESNVFVRDLSLDSTMLVTANNAVEPTTEAAPAPAGAGTSLPVVAPTGTGTGVATGIATVPTGTGTSISTGPATVPTGTGTSITTGPATVPTGTATQPGSAPVPTGTATGTDTGTAVPLTGTTGDQGTATTIAPTGNAAGLSTGTPVVPTGNGGGVGNPTPVVPSGIAGSLGTTTPVVPTGSTFVAPTGNAGGLANGSPVVPTGNASGLGTDAPVVFTGTGSSLITGTPVPTTMTLAAIAIGGGRPSISPDGNWVAFESRGQASGVFLANLRTGVISRIN